MQFTASARLHEKLERLRALMRSQVPDGDLGAIIEAAVTEKLERLEARRFAATSRPRKNLSKADTSPASRHIPAPVRRAVRERDGNRCGYVDAAGRRCDERDRLEYHHLHPFGLGGDHRPENIRLMCGAHNAYLAEHDYGREAMARFRRPGKRVQGAVAVASVVESRARARGGQAPCARHRPVPDRAGCPGPRAGPWTFGLALAGQADGHEASARQHLLQTEQPRGRRRRPAGRAPPASSRSLPWHEADVARPDPQELLLRRR